MTMTPFFLELHAAYQSELDDLATDSEGRDVLQQRLREKRREIGFLAQMMELSPEMVAVVFHRGFQFREPAVMEQLLTLDADDLPDWDAIAEAVELAPWAQELADTILTEPAGPWFMTLAAALEYMHARPGRASDEGGDDTDDEDREDADEDQDDDGDDADQRARDEAGADWLSDQGFDRKD
jgi:hypothetical protein